VNACSLTVAARPCTAFTFCIIEWIAQLIGSMSSAVGSRPATVPENAIARLTWAQNTTPNNSCKPSVCHGGSTSSTSWPSSRSSSAASSTACAARGSTAASGTGGKVVAAIRSGAGSRAAACANGSGEAGAQVASPTS
jgi:hypothetical protein